MQNEATLIKKLVAEVPPMSATAFDTGRQRLTDTLDTQQRGARTRRIVRAAWGLTLVVLAIAWASGYFIDLQVYRNGGLAWLHGIPLYFDFPGPLEGPRLPFTYPPIAAVFFSLLAALPVWLANTAVVMVNFVVLSVVCVVVVGHVRPRLMWTVGPVAAIVFLALEPVSSTFSFGQVNLLLMALVVLDCLVVDRRFRGVLVGVATAIKLTPAIFVLYFLVKRDWRAAITSMATFAGLGGVGFLLAPKDSMEYWFHALLDPSRVGGLAYAMNQSLRGVLHRFNPGASVEGLLWVGLAGAVVLLAVIAAWRSRDDVVALLAIATAGLLVSPVSWSHHWVWCVPAFLYFGLRATSWVQRGIVAVVFAVFVFQPAKWLPSEQDREMAWSVLQHVPGDAYVWAAIALLVVLAAGLWPPRKQLTSANRLAE